MIKLPTKLFLLMVAHFYLRYNSFFGQSITIALREVSALGEDQFSFIDLNYLNEEYWHLVYNHIPKYKNSTIEYYCILKDNGKEIRDHWQIRTLGTIDQEVMVYDDWQHSKIERNVFNSRAFSKVLITEKLKPSLSSVDKPTHHFYVMATQLPEGKGICLLGSSDALGKWDANKAILLDKENEAWTLKLDLSKAQFPMEYKFATYDLKNKKAEHLEDAANRKLNAPEKKEVPIILHQYVDLKKYAWKGAGVNVQLSALKTNKSWGVGDFSDINILSDWSAAVGIKMIQLLPINDTTSTYTRADSYPYSAVSAFALHPIYLDIEKIVTENKIAIPAHLIAEPKKLNEYPTLDYENVYKIKQQAAKLVFESAANDFLKEKSFTVYFNENRHWLVPYAAFCFLRDKFQTADFSQWGEFANYNDKLIQQLVDEKSDAFSEIAFTYFVQYHLHLQLSDAVEYAHKLGIIMKGDLPIGVGRFSMDTWMNPSLFHMDMQAGAPPDAFAKKGQNWSFPTYNWDAMKATNYAWWRQRLTHMSHYFDATRIDHVLGFFRIWSVPMHAIEGVFGVFVPAIGFTKADFEKSGLQFDESRFCNPYINDDMLQNMFGDKASDVKLQFMNGNAFKEELNTQRKIEFFSKSNNIDPLVKQKLFDLLGEVILFKDDKNNEKYHFRIDIHDTISFKELSHNEQEKLNRLYVQYFYEKQNDLWYRVAQEKLDAIQQSSDMMICAEDLGMVPDMVEDVLKSREMLALQVQRMPKKSYQQFSHPNDAPYLSVVTPSTHDMSTIRQWWEEDVHLTQRFYNDLLLHTGKAPQFCEPEICKEIIYQHLKSPAMWCVFLLQDLMSIDDKTRRGNPNEERINNPADPNHFWNYRMHLTLESLKEQSSFNETLLHIISDTQRF